MSNADAPPSDAFVLADRYRVLKPIGQGGMGAVFEAVHVLTGRKLAVKTLLAQYVNDPVLVERFMREARATATINDPHVIEIVDIGRTAEGDVFMVMELLDGRELKRAIREETPLPVERACYIVHQIAAVMGRAHAIGIIHRDLKPANVFLVRRDRDPDYVKVLDFGIAKLDARVTGEAVTSGQTMTRTGQLIGTPSYMSPEQLQGLKKLDARSDVYSLGVILYQCVAGELPIKGESIPDIFLKVMTTESPSLGDCRDDVPPELSAIVRRALAREPAERFEDGTAFAAALEPFASRWTVGSPPTATGVTLRARGGASGASARSSSGLSAPRVIAPAAHASTPDATTPPPVSPSPLPLRGALAVGAVVVASMAALALWTPWRLSGPQTTPADARSQPPVDAAVTTVPHPPASPDASAREEPDAAAREAPDAALDTSAEAASDDATVPTAPRRPPRLPPRRHDAGAHVEPATPEIMTHQ